MLQCKAMDSLVVMSLFLLSGALGIGLAWAAMSLVFLLMRNPMRGVPMQGSTSRPQHVMPNLTA
jgi:hypothetical protein